MLNYHKFELQPCDPRTSWGHVRTPGSASRLVLAADKLIVVALKIKTESIATKRSYDDETTSHIQNEG